MKTTVIATFNFYKTLLPYAEEDPNILDKIIWNDKASFKLNGKVNRHNYIYWSDSNTYMTIENNLNLPVSTVWASISSTGLIGLFFL